MDDLRFGAVIRSVRIRRGWRQSDLATKSGISRPAISRLERGHAGPMNLDDIRAVATALEVRAELLARWRGGDLDRLLNAKHSALHEAVARWFRARYPAWILAPEVTFAIYADRGVIDIFGWHPGRRAALVIELKTEIVDVNELVGTLDRKCRVATRVARERGWDPLTISAWLVVADTRTSRRRVEAHQAMLRNALPAAGPTVRNWLRDPSGRVAGMSFWGRSSVRRVRP